MNYQKIYNQLIKKRQTEKLTHKNDFTVELHHIIPKSCGGKNTDDNLVELTLREHYIAHMLLVKIAEQNNDDSMLQKMILAVFYIVNGRKRKLNGIHMTSRMYEFLKSNQTPIWLGRHHTDQSRAKIRATMTKNGIKGKRTWMHKGNVIKYVANEKIQDFIKAGFSYGRPGYKPCKGMHGKLIRI